MRRIILCGVALAGLAGASAAAANTCLKPADDAAFGVAALKSELMVVALSCEAQDRYNAFVSRYRNELQSNERSMQAYFVRAYGRNGEEEHDNYITSLANAQSIDQIHQGPGFCKQATALFDEVLGLPNGVDIAGFAATKTLVQPLELEDCPPDARTARR
jgi:hypothetical protein